VDSRADTILRFRGGWSRILTGWVVCVHGTMSEGAIHTLRKLIAGLGVAGEAPGYT
jgi:hypothetical protein